MNIQILIEKSIYIEEIILDYNDINLNDSFVKLIIEYCKCLKVLSLDSCGSAITDLCFTKLSQEFFDY